MHLGPLADDERVKLILPQARCYCASRQSLGSFPPRLLLRRYLKIAVGLSLEQVVTPESIANPPEMPFVFQSIPLFYSPPNTLCLWITDRDVSATVDG